MSLDPWKPSRREQRLRWWIDLVVKTAIRTVGVVGVVYTLFIRPNPIGMLVSGAMGTSLDIGQFAVGLFRAAREEAKQIKEISRQQEEQSDGSRDD